MTFISPVSNIDKKISFLNMKIYLFAYYIYFIILFILMLMDFLIRIDFLY